MKYYQGFTQGNPAKWKSEDTWVPRRVHYPVEKSFRSFYIKKGKYPYVLIVDDSKKDDQERLYNWNLHLPSELEAYSMDWSDIILGKISRQ